MRCKSSTLSSTSSPTPPLPPPLSTFARLPRVHEIFISNNTNQHGKVVLQQQQQIWRRPETTAADQRPWKILYCPVLILWRKQDLPSIWLLFIILQHSLGCRASPSLQSSCCCCCCGRRKARARGAKSFARSVLQGDRRRTGSECLALSDCKAMVMVSVTGAGTLSGNNP